MMRTQQNSTSESATGLPRGVWLLLGTTAATAVAMASAIVAAATGSDPVAVIGAASGPGIAALVAWGGVQCIRRPRTWRLSQPERLGAASPLAGAHER